MSLVYRLADAAADMASLGAAVHYAGCFRACIEPASDLAQLNYAIPWASPFSYEQVRLAVGRLQEIFKAHGRRLRIEYIMDAWPWLGPLLEDMNFARESSFALMACTPETFQPAVHANVRFIDAQDSPGIEDFLVVQAAVFPGEAGDPGLVSYQIAQGFWRCAVASVGAAAAAAGSLVPQGRIAELAAMATLPDYRRRGLGSAIVSALVRAHFEAGGELAWLAVGAEGVAPLYQRAGFRHIGCRIRYVSQITQRLAAPTSGVVRQEQVSTPASPVLPPLTFSVARTKIYNNISPS